MWILRAFGAGARIVCTYRYRQPLFGNEQYHKGLVETDGVMYRLGLNWPWVTHAIMGPFGVLLLLGLRCVPFSYLAITAALAGLGQEFEDAARVHGASRMQAMRLVVPILAPAIASALAIGFAESISDFGVAATLAYNSNFSLATYQLYAAIGNFPPSFPLAAGMAWLLVAAVAIPLALQARVSVDAGDAMRIGRGWLDHEWSSTLLPPAAAGWDWAGFNLDDGSALTAFRIRSKGRDGPDGARFAYASLRAPGGAAHTFPASEVAFEPLQSWTSPRTRAVYPVAQRIRVGSRQFETRPLMPDQELDARASSAIAYWEGASELLEDGRVVGRGYLELTGYAGRPPG